MRVSILIFQVVKEVAPIEIGTFACPRMMVFVSMFRAAKERTSVRGKAPPFQGR
jgi:hypothetical protein